jgi:hypothetical protein
LYVVIDRHHQLRESLRQLVGHVLGLLGAGLEVQAQLGTIPDAPLIARCAPRRVACVCQRRRAPRYGTHRVSTASSSRPTSTSASVATTSSRPQNHPHV